MVDVFVNHSTIKDQNIVVPKYHSFLVRLWASQDNGDPTWHFSLESSETGEKRIFANLQELLAFFENLTGASWVSGGDAQDESWQ
jgi:hypothetical protein